MLKPGGDLLILNFSYRRNLEQDRRDMAAMARGAGLSIVRNGTRDLTTWDGVTFHLVKRG